MRRHQHRLEHQPHAVLETIALLVGQVVQAHQAVDLGAENRTGRRKARRAKRATTCRAASRLGDRLVWIRGLTGEEEELARGPAPRAGRRYHSPAGLPSMLPRTCAPGACSAASCREILLEHLKRRRQGRGGWPGCRSRYRRGRPRHAADGLAGELKSMPTRSPEGPLVPSRCASAGEPGSVRGRGNVGSPQSTSARVRVSQPRSKSRCSAVGSASPIVGGMSPERTCSCGSRCPPESLRFCRQGSWRGYSPDRHQPQALSLPPSGSECSRRSAGAGRPGRGAPMTLAVARVRVRVRYGRGGRGRRGCPAGSRAAWRVPRRSSDAGRRAGGRVK